MKKKKGRRRILSLDTFYRFLFDSQLKSAVDDDDNEDRVLEVNDGDSEDDGEDDFYVDVKEDKVLVVQAGEVLAAPIVEAVERSRGAGQVLRAAGGWRRVS